MLSSCFRTLLNQKLLKWVKPKRISSHPGLDRPGSATTLNRFPEACLHLCLPLRVCEAMAESVKHQRKPSVLLRRGSRGWLRSLRHRSCKRLDKVTLRRPQAVLRLQKVRQTLLMQCRIMRARVCATTYPYFLTELQALAAHCICKLFNSSAIAFISS